MSESYSINNSNKQNSDNNQKWQQVGRLQRLSHRGDRTVDIQTTEVKSNRFVQGLTNLSEQLNSESNRKTSMNGRNMNVLYQLNSEQDKKQKEREEYRELMQTYMYRRPKNESIKTEEVLIQPEPINVLDPMSFPDIAGKPIVTEKTAVEDSFSSVFDELVIDVKKQSNPWTKKDIKTIMEQNKDKKVVSLSQSKPRIQKVELVEAVEIMVDFTSIYDDLLEKKPLENTEEVQEQEDPIDNDGFMKVIKQKKPRKQLY